MAYKPFKMKGSPMKRNFGIDPKDTPKTWSEINRPKSPAKHEGGGKHGHSDKEMTKHIKPKPEKVFAPTEGVHIPAKVQMKEEHDKQVERELRGRASSQVQEHKDMQTKGPKGQWMTTASDTASYRKANPNIDFKWKEVPEEDQKLYHERKKGADKTSPAKTKDWETIKQEIKDAPGQILEAVKGIPANFAEDLYHGPKREIEKRRKQKQKQKKRAAQADQPTEKILPGQSSPAKKIGSPIKKAGIWDVVDPDDPSTWKRISKEEAEKKKNKDYTAALRGGKESIEIAPTKGSTVYDWDDAIDKVKEKRDELSDERLHHEDITPKYREVYDREEYDEIGRRVGLDEAEKTKADESKEQQRKRAADRKAQAKLDASEVLQKKGTPAKKHAKGHGGPSIKPGKKYPMRPGDVKIDHSGASKSKTKRYMKTKSPIKSPHRGPHLHVPKPKPRPRPKPRPDIDPDFIRYKSNYSNNETIR